MPFGATAEKVPHGRCRYVYIYYLYIIYICIPMYTVIMSTHIFRDNYPHVEHSWNTQMGSICGCLDTEL
jgi:hypothetical protein